MVSGEGFEPSVPKASGLQSEGSTVLPSHSFDSSIARLGALSTPKLKNPQTLLRVLFDHSSTFALDRTLHIIFDWNYGAGRLSEGTSLVPYIRLTQFLPIVFHSSFVRDGVFVVYAPYLIIPFSPENRLSFYLNSNIMG